MAPNIDIPQTAIRIRNVQTGRMLYDNPDHGLISWQESKNVDGYWFITPFADNVYKIKNQLSGNNIYFNVSAQRPLTWRDTPNEDGKWEIVPVNDGTFKIRNLHTPHMFLFDNPTHGVIGYEDNNHTDGIWSILKK